MEKSIETIWKEGFLHEKSLVAPKINDLYNQKSKHLVDKVETMFRINLIVLVIMAITFPVIHYFVDAFLQGVAASVLLLLTAWYMKQKIDTIKTLDQGATSFDYLKSFDQWLKGVLLESQKIVRFSYPLYLLIAFSTIWSAWTQQGMTSKMQQKFPNSFFIEHMPLFAFLIAGVMVLLIYIFGIRIYRWEVRLMYGRVFRKLEETIQEMERLKQG